MQLDLFEYSCCLRANENQKERTFTAKQSSAVQSEGLIRPRVQSNREATLDLYRFSLFCLFYSHGIYRELPTLFDRYLFALRFSPDRGISPRISPCSVSELLLIGGEKTNAQTAIRLSRVFGLSRRSLVNRAFQSHFQEPLGAARAVQPAGAEDGSPGEELLVPQDDGVGQGRG